MNRKQTCTEEQPWPGLFSYTEKDADFFYGRETELRQLYNTIQNYRITVVFGPSGTGKTSLLQAGVFPNLRKSNLLPIILRSGEISAGEHSLCDNVKSIIRSECSSNQYELDESQTLPLNSTTNESLWEFLQRIEIWSPSMELIEPVIVFDQFEEWLRMNGSSSAKNIALAEIIENYIPESIKCLKPDSKWKEIIAARRQPWKCVICLREDFLGKLEDLQDRMPSVMAKSNRFPLRRMTYEQAKLAILNPGKKYVTEETAEKMLEFFAAKNLLDGKSRFDEYSKTVFEPALLSHVCRELNEKRIQEGAVQIVANNMSLAAEEVLKNFYGQCFLGFKTTKAQWFVEDSLIDPSNNPHRTFATDAQAKHAGVEDNELEHLITRRLLRRDTYSGGSHLELSHDVLIAPVRESRDARHEKQALEKAEKEALKAQEEKRKRIEAEQLAEIAKSARKDAEELVVFLITEVSEKLDAREHLSILSPLADRLKLHFDKMDKSSASPEILRYAVKAFLQIADVRKREGRFELAAESYRLSIDSADIYQVNWKMIDHLLAAKALINLGKTLTHELDNPDNGIKALMRAVEVLNPKGSDNYSLFEPYSNAVKLLINVLKNQGRSDEVVKISRTLNEYSNETTDRANPERATAIDYNTSVKFGFTGQTENVTRVYSQYHTKNDSAAGFIYNSAELNKLIASIIEDATASDSISAIEKLEQWSQETESKYRMQVDDAEAELLQHPGDIERECTLAAAVFSLAHLLWDKAWTDSKKESDALLLKSFLILENIDKSDDRRIPGYARKLWEQIMHASANRLITYALNNDTPALQHLIDSGLPVNLQNEKMRTALMAAAAHGKHLALRYLLEAGADPELRNSVGGNALLWACEEGQFESVDILLMHGVNIHALIKEETSALMLSAQYKRKDLIALLLEHGFNIDFRNNDGWTALSFAVAYGYKDIVDLLLEKGADIHCTNNFGHNNLITAAANNQKEMIIFFLEKDFDIEFKDKDGWTALMWAIRQGHKEVIELLLEKGADIHCTNNFGHNNLIIAAINNQKEMVAFFLEKDFDIESKDNNGWTALMSAVRNGHINIVDLLLEKGADIHCTNNFGHNNLIIAAGNNQKEMVQFFLEEDFDIESKDNNGWTALMFAVHYGYMDIVDLLLEKGADIHYTNNNGHNNLMIAAANNQKEMVTFLLENGFEIEYKDNSGWTALMFAVQNGNLDIIDLLIEKGADIHCTNNSGSNNLIITAANNQKEMIEYFLEKGFDIEFKNTYGWTALMHAVSKGHTNIVDLLLEKGADIHCTNNSGHNNLIIAAINNQKEMVALLLQKGFEIEYKDNAGNTALMQAIGNGAIETIDLLLKKGSDINHVNKYGENSLIVAAMNNQKEMVSFLLEKGFDINYKDTAGWTALTYSISKGNKEVLDLLIEKGADIQFKCNDGSNGLLRAVIANKAEFVKFFLSNDFDIDSKDHNSRTALMHAVNYGRHQIINLLLEKNPNLELKNISGWTALMIAVQYGYEDIIDLLIKKGANIYCTDNDGLNNLIIAAINNQKEMVAFFLEKGFDIEFKDNNGWTALMHSVGMGHSVIVDFLLEKGADIQCTNIGGSNNLIIAAANNQKKMVSFFLEKGFDIEYKDNWGWTALMHAVGSGHSNIVDLLLEKGADINCLAKGGANNLIIAAGNNQKDMVDFFLEKGFDIEFEDKMGFTALMSAVQYGFSDIVDTLLRKGADKKHYNGMGTNAALCSAVNNHKELCLSLLGTSYEIIEQVLSNFLLVCDEATLEQALCGIELNFHESKEEKINHYLSLLEHIDKIEFKPLNLVLFINCQLFSYFYDLKHSKKAIEYENKIIKIAKEIAQSTPSFSYAVELHEANSAFNYLLLKEYDTAQRIAVEMREKYLDNLAAKVVYAYSLLFPGNEIEAFNQLKSFNGMHFTDGRSLKEGINDDLTVFEKYALEQPLIEKIRDFLKTF
jgi:ankyrin repeat protein